MIWGVWLPWSFDDAGRSCMEGEMGGMGGMSVSLNLSDMWRFLIAFRRNMGGYDDRSLRKKRVGVRALCSRRQSIVLSVGRLPRSCEQ